MLTHTVLVLDDPYFLGKFQLARLVTEDDIFPASDTYSPQESLLSYLRSVAIEAYSLIVIGNNLGAGLRKAAVISESMRNKCVIVWNDLPGSRELEPYQQLGYTRFTTRRYFEQYLEEHPELLAEE